MACRGVHFALTPEEANRLLSKEGNDDAIIEVIQEEIEERWDEEWLCETDKAWDAIHRCLASAGEGVDSAPLSKCVLGARQLHAGEAYIVSYADPDEVRAIAAELGKIDEEWMRHQYASIADLGYEGRVGEDDFVYTWDNFRDLREFFLSAAAAGRPVVFSVDQ